MILKLSKTKRLSFYRKTEIYIGEKDFDEIQVLIPSEVDENDTSELTFKLHLVNERGEYAIRTLTVEQEGTKVVGSTSITADLTSVAQDFSVYIEMVKSNDTIIGKTNVLEVRVNPLPDEQGEIIPEEIEKRGVIIAQTNPPDSSHKKYRLGALWINYADETQYVLTDIDESQAPQEYGYVRKKVSNQTVISSDSAPEYTPNNVDYKYSVGDVWVQTDSNAEKIVAISVCTGNTKVTIDAQNWKYNYTWAVLASGSNDYTDLTNKPSINNVTLQGNKSSDDLSLQGKLTAGENITISDDNVISAEGGTDDYGDLTNKPQINGVTVDGSKSNQDFGFSNFYYSPDYPPLYQSSSVNYQIHDIWIRTNPAPITTTNPFSQQIPYILQSIWNGNTLIWEPLRVTVHISDDPYVITPPKYELEDSRVLKYRAGDLWMARSVYGSDSTTPYYRIQSLYICIGSHRQSKPPYNQYNITWQRIDNKVRSGVVNSNGSITFTNSDGTTFTTSGTSVIGADGFSPTATVTQTASGATVSITDKNGTTTANISNGQDYILTTQDKDDIADIVLAEFTGSIVNGELNTR